MRTFTRAILISICFFLMATLAIAQVPTITITNLDTFAIRGLPTQTAMKICINTGVSSSLALEKLVIKSLCQDSTDVDSVAVFYTTTYNRFSLADYASDAPSLLAKRQKFHHDSTVFIGLGFTLSAGNNYFWVVLDLSKTSKAAHYLNVTTRAEGITINGTGYPATAPPAPSQQIPIWQKYFTENFEKTNANGTPYNWLSRYYDSNKVNWYLHQGGYGTQDNIPGNGNPSNAKSGKTNARFAAGDIMWHSSM